MENGVIYKSLGGFYYVKTSEGRLATCKPRGVFRKMGLRPVAGDRVLLSPQAAGEDVIDEVLPRKNIFIRPPVANVDVLFIVASTVQPVPNLLLLDKLAVLAQKSGASPVLVFTKTDLDAGEEMREVYSKTGLCCIVADAKTGGGLAQISGKMKGKLCVFTGNSGVGKSTLINALLPLLQRETAEISQKLGRGRHTTREVEIFEAFGGLLADTPGFSSLNLEFAGSVDKQEIMYYFPEIEENLGSCRFANCRHIGEAGCRIKALAQQGKISQARYKNYTLLYEEAEKAEGHGKRIW